jgi:hypothetical protein
MARFLKMRKKGRKMKYGEIFITWAVIFNLLTACTVPGATPPASEEADEPTPTAVPEAEDAESAVADK